MTNALSTQPFSKSQWHSRRGEPVDAYNAGEFGRISREEDHACGREKCTRVIIARDIAINVNGKGVAKRTTEAIRCGSSIGAAREESRGIERNREESRRYTRRCTYTRVPESGVKYFLAARTKAGFKEFPPGRVGRTVLSRYFE